MNFIAPDGRARTGDYAGSLHRWAEKVKAKHILEVGLGGHMVSGLAFVDSLANRPPGFLTSIEVVPDTTLPEDIRAAAEARGVYWRVLHDDGQYVHLTGIYDLIYMDGPCSELGVMRCWDNLFPLLRKGGIFVIDGIGERQPKQGHPGTNEAVAALEKRYGAEFEKVYYIPDCGFAAYRS